MHDKHLNHELGLDPLIPIIANNAPKLEFDLARGIQNQA